MRHAFTLFPSPSDKIENYKENAKSQTIAANVSCIIKLRCALDPLCCCLPLATCVVIVASFDKKNSLVNSVKHTVDLLWLQVYFLFVLLSSAQSSLYSVVLGGSTIVYGLLCCVQRHELHEILFGMKRRLRIQTMYIFRCCKYTYGRNRTFSVLVKQRQQMFSSRKL